MEASCMQLSIEGERLLKAQDFEGAIKHFEAGLRVGTDDDEVLSAVYNQLGNACFYAGKFNKALEYHKKDLEIAEKLGDRQGQAKAFGNLGNTFKSLKEYARAIRCCEEHLQLTRELNDRLGEGRACYNLGNVHHAMGKAKLPSQDKQVSSEGRKSVMKAIDYYKATLKITGELNDISGEGRAVGNLGNAYTAIGEFAEAITYHERRLKIAEQAKDLAAKARACGNLGNAYSAQGEFSDAIKYYLMSLDVAKESKNIAGEGQAYYCLGSTYTLQKNFVKAVEYFELHLGVATKVGDKSGQLRAWYNLRNAYHALGDNDKTVHYHQLIQQSQPKKTNLTVPKPESKSKPGTPQMEKKSKKGGAFKFSKFIATKKKNTGVVEEFAPDDSDDDDIVRVRKGNEAPAKSKKKINSATEWLNDAIKASKEESQANPPAASTAPKNSGSSTVPDSLDMFMQPQTRMNDQRSGGGPRLGGDISSQAVVGTEHNEDFFDMLVLMQGNRLDTQRSPAPKNFGASLPNAGPAATFTPPQPRKQLNTELDPENMSLFEMLAVAKKQSEG